MPKIECLKFKEHKTGSLEGFADLSIPKMGIEVYGCALYMKQGRRWVNMPAREFKDEDGETKWIPVIRFKDPEHMKVFIQFAVEAIDEWRQQNNDALMLENTNKEQKI